MTPTRTATASGPGSPPSMTGSPAWRSIWSALDALEVRQLVEAQADRLFHQLKHDADRTADLPMPGRATLLAMALVELVRRGSIVDREHTTGPAVDVTLVVEATKPTRRPT